MLYLNSNISKCVRATKFLISSLLHKGGWSLQFQCLVFRSKLSPNLTTSKFHIDLKKYFNLPSLWILSDNTVFLSVYISYELIMWKLCLFILLFNEYLNMKKKCDTFTCTDILLQQQLSKKNSTCLSTLSVVNVESEFRLFVRVSTKYTESCTDAWRYGIYVQVFNLIF